MQILDNHELKKIFDFVLENDCISLDGSSPFSRKTLVSMNHILSGISKNIFELTEEQKEVMVWAFIHSQMIHLLVSKRINAV